MAMMRAACSLATFSVNISCTTARDEEREHRVEYRVGVGLEDVGAALHGHGVGGKCLVHYRQKLFVAQSLAAHALEVHVEEIEHVDVPVEKLLLESRRESLHSLAVALGMDVAYYLYSDAVARELAGGLDHLVAYRIQGYLKRRSVALAQLVDAQQKALEDIDIVGATQTVVTAPHGDTRTGHVARKSQRRAEFGVGRQEIAHDGLDLAAEGGADGAATARPCASWPMKSSSWRR